MKLSNIIVGQVIRFGKVSAPGGGTVYELSLSKACEERYGFLQAPRVLADYDLSKGVTFLHGFFNNRVIDKFQVFSNGILAEAKLDTDECDHFLDDVLKWIVERGGIEFTPSDSMSRLYNSQLEIQSDVEFGRSFPTLAPLGRQIADILRGYGHHSQQGGFAVLLYRETDVPHPVRHDALTLDGVEETLTTWKLRGPHGG